MSYCFRWGVGVEENFSAWFINKLILQGRMIGLVVAETKELGHLAKEDRSILATCFKKGTKVGYILSLGTHNLETSFLGIRHSEGGPHFAPEYLPHPRTLFPNLFCLHAKCLYFQIFKSLWHHHNHNLHIQNINHIFW